MIKTFLIILVLIMISCKNFSSPEAEYKDNFIRKSIVAENKVQLHDSLIIIGKPFKVNKVDCFWKLTQRFYKGEDIGESTMELVSAKTLKTVLKTEDFYDDQNYTSINLNTKNANNFKDANFDGQRDYVVYSRLGSGQGGDAYNVYLFNLKRKIFEISEMSGGNIEIDSINKTVKTYWKAGIGWNQETIHQFEKGGRLKFTEIRITEFVEEDSIKETYKKLVNGKVVKLKVRTIANQ